MTLANFLTTLRIALTPCCILFIMWEVPHNRLIALVIFIIAFLTDILDGIVARAANKITDFGKLFDPLADKILVISILVTLAFKIKEPWYWTAVMIIWLREIFIALLRRRRAPQGVATEANLYGKTKTLLQVLAVCTLILNIMIAPYILWAAVAFSVYSGIRYVNSWQPRNRNTGS